MHWSLHLLVNGFYLWFCSSIKNFCFYEFLLQFLFFLNFIFSYSVANCDRAGHFSACETWLLLWWPFDKYALQWWNRYNWNATVHHNIRLSDFMDIRSVFLCASITEIITFLRIGETRMEMVQRILIRNCITFLCHWWRKGMFGFFFFIFPSLSITTWLNLISTFNGNRYYLVNWDHISWIHVAQMPCKRVLEGKLHIFNHNCCSNILQCHFWWFFFSSFKFRQYVVDWHCTNNIDNSWFVRDASKSFPSGHSSTAFFEAVFLIW